MKRYTVAFLVLAAAGGCLAMNQDPMDVYDAPRRPAAQAWSAGGQNSWQGNGNSYGQASANNYGGRSYGSAAAVNSWYNSGQGAATPRNPYGSGSTTTVAKAPSSRPRSYRVDDKLVKATYTKAKPAQDDDDADTLSASTDKKKPTAAKKVPVEAPRPPAEAKALPVNLGVLRLLNSKRITFHYEVKDPSAGTAGLELWGTTDMRSWKKFDIASRTPKSLVVEVKDEGLYGFSILARGKDDAARNQPPLPGDAPQVWVAVDMTKPVVQLLGAELNVLAKTPALVIRWTAKDTHFGPRPITLLYSEKADGPWAPVAANLENSGRYEWIMPPCVPGNVHVRVQATDLMGNVGTAQTATLHIPGRDAGVSSRAPTTTSEPPRLSSVPAPTYEPMLRPVAATAPSPGVSILSVDNE